MVRRVGPAEHLLQQKDQVPLDPCRVAISCAARAHVGRHPAAFVNSDAKAAVRVRILIAADAAGGLKRMRCAVQTVCGAPLDRALNVLGRLLARAALDLSVPYCDVGLQEAAHHFVGAVAGGRLRLSEKLLEFVQMTACEIALCVEECSNILRIAKNRRALGRVALFQPRRILSCEHGRSGRRLNKLHIREKIPRLYTSNETD